MTEPAKKRPTGPTPVEPANDGGAQAPPSPEPPARSAPRDLRRQRAIRLGLRLAIGIGVPTLVAGIYYGFVDSREYESVATFTVQSADTNAPTGIETILSSVSTSTGRDVRIVQDFIRSRGMLRLLSDEHDVTAHFSDPELDYFSRLPPDASFEERYEYYREQVDAEYDTEAGAVTLRVRAFDRDTA